MFATTEFFFLLYTYATPYSLYKLYLHNEEYDEATRNKTTVRQGLSLLIGGLSSSMAERTWFLFYWDSDAMTLDHGPDVGVQTLHLAE